MEEDSFAALVITGNQDKLFQKAKQVPDAIKKHLKPQENL